ncbi:MAG: hypothetical protein M9895_03410 [Aquamicrobium sp.]|uniref:hypothetical protein n=1 Tax=Aquamicrobium sp. TaxID=1872579 RepID=UPI00349ED0AA|nr:hypothetical protein [Aquamicrobium sp.]MCO5158999.1 hypothetical protein [Aquamicrobium sp.]
MKREISEAALPGRTVDLWTPWGILRLTDPDDAARPERKPRPRLWMRPAGERPVHERPTRERDIETRA